VVTTTLYVGLRRIVRDPRVLAELTKVRGPRKRVRRVPQKKLRLCATKTRASTGSLNTVAGGACRPRGCRAAGRERYKVVQTGSDMLGSGSATLVFEGFDIFRKAARQPVGR